VKKRRTKLKLSFVVALVNKVRLYVTIAALAHLILKEEVKTHPLFAGGPK
jgi:hypothetical protein